MIFLRHQYIAITHQQGVGGQYQIHLRHFVKTIKSVLAVQGEYRQIGCELGGFVAPIG